MMVDGQKITPTLVRALLALPRFEKYVNTVQCKACKMVQRSKTTKDRHKEDCPVARVEGLLLLLETSKVSSKSVEVLDRASRKYAKALERLANR